MVTTVVIIGLMPAKKTVMSILTNSDENSVTIVATTVVTAIVTTASGYSGDNGSDNSVVTARSIIFVRNKRQPVVQYPDSENIVKT